MSQLALLNQLCIVLFLQIYAAETDNINDFLTIIKTSVIHYLLQSI